MVRLCSIAGCDRKHSQRGLCKMHETRERRTGTTADPIPRQRTACAIDECGRWVESKGLCQMHNQRLKSNGDPLIVRHGGWKAKTPFEKFRDHLVSGSPDECWPWRGTTNTYGYGVIGYVDSGRKRQAMATRISYMLHRGPIPEGMLICHTCDNRSCVNPLHLYAGTYQDNADDRWSDMPTPRPNPEIGHNPLI